jgi:membrane protease YdiL (CAAX protease family)
VSESALPKRAWPKTGLVLVGLLVLWLTLHGSASALGSLRGEWGLLVAALVLIVAVAWESLIGGLSIAKAATSLGLKTPTLFPLLGTLAVSAVLICLLPLCRVAFGTPIAVTPSWYLYVPGLLAQAGIAEEVVFRGYLFRHFREGRSFWRAALLSALPFVLVHLFLFATLDAVVALASLALALSLSFPLAWIFEASGNSVWPPALVHFVVQGAIKLVEVPAPDFLPIVTIWMLAGAVLPWILFLVPSRHTRVP